MLCADGAPRDSGARSADETSRPDVSPHCASWQSGASGTGSRVKSTSARLARAGVVLLLVAGGAFAISTSGVRSGERASEVSDDAVGTVRVRRAPLRVTVSSRGTLKSLNSKLLVSRVEWRTRIIDLVPEGAWVVKGQVVCELDSSELEKKLKERQVRYTRARASLRQARENLELQKLDNERHIAAAKLALALADLDLKKFRDGEFPQQRKSLQSEITLAEEALTRARAYHDFVKRMAIKGYRSRDDVEKARIDLVEAQVDLRTAEDKADVLKDFTYERTITELEHFVEETRRRLERVRNQAELALLQVKAELSSSERSFRIHREYMKRLQMNIAACTIRASQAGQVIHANDDSSRRHNREPIQLGAQVRYRQPIIKLPDLSRMAVGTRIHESHINQVEVGQPAAVRVEADQDRVYRGRVASVATVPAETRWSQPELKEFEVLVELADKRRNQSGPRNVALKPGLTAEVEVEIDRRDFVLQVPLSAVVEVAGERWCFVISPDGPEQRHVDVGQSDEFAVEIVGGLSEGEPVAASPRTELAGQLARLEVSASETSAAAAIGD